MDGTINPGWIVAPCAGQPASDAAVRTSILTERANRSLLPVGLVQRCLSQRQAATYVGVGEDVFTGLVNDGVLPNGLKFRGRRVWDRVALDRALDRLSGFSAIDNGDDHQSKGTSGPSPLAKVALMEAIRAGL
jgi:hypothetical protein